MIGRRFAMPAGFLALCGMIPLVLEPVAGPIRLDPVKIDAVFKAYNRTTPGCALGIYHDGAVAYSKGYGMADLSLGVPIAPGTMFDIGSTSKQFAAASVVLLANEGKVALSDDVRKYIPELPDYGTTITIDHMLRHTSGLRDYNGLLYLKGYKFEDFTGDDEALDVIVRQRNLNFTPGTKWDYSNTGFFLLSVIVKRVTGKTLAQFAKERLFQPLGMPRTNFRDDHTVILAGRATGYDPGEKGGYQIDMSDWDQLGDGAVNTNVIELARWDENFYTARVGGRALIDRLTERGTLSTGDTLEYARGLFVDTYRGLRRVHHGGAWAGYRAMLMRFPDQHLSIATLCNRADANTQAKAEAVADVVLAGAFRAAEPRTAGPAAGGNGGGTGSSRSAPNLAGYEGTYFGEEAQQVIRIGQENGHLTLGFGGTNLPLEPVSEGRFKAKGFPVTVEFSGDEMTLSLLNESQGSFRKVPPFTPSTAELSELAGAYYSPELDATWQLVLENGQPALKARGIGTQALKPAIKDGYSSGQGFARFTRDASGKLTGFDFTASRMKRIRFDRR